MPYCPHCGSPYKVIHEYCPHCGEKVSAAPQNTDYADVTRRVTGTGNRSGQGKSTMVPPGVEGWNWGAFLLSWIWGIGNNVWISLIALLGIILWPVGLVMSIVLGIKGNEWAWQNKRWDSIEHFKHTQRTWAWVGLGVTIVLVVLPILAAIIVPNIAHFIDEEGTDANNTEFKSVRLAMTALLTDCHSESLTVGGVVGDDLVTLGDASDDIGNVSCDSCSYTLNDYLDGAENMKCDYAFTTSGEVRQSRCR